MLYCKEGECSSIKRNTFCCFECEDIKNCEHKCQLDDCVYYKSMKRMTGLYDKNNIELGENDKLIYIDPDDEDIKIIFTVKYGKGSYDSGFYPYIGFYLKDENGYTDGNARFMFEKENIEVIKKQRG